MANQIELAQELKALHVMGNPLILFNIWDAGSAKAIQTAGAKVIATGSWSVAAARGYGDREQIPIDDVIANLKRIIASVDLPVTLDLESGYGETASEVQQTVVKVIEAGAVGINLEDQKMNMDGLYSIDEQCERIRAVRTVADSASIPLFINARTDIFLKVIPAEHDTDHVEEAIHRAKRYAEAGANGFFAPGLKSANYIETLCAQSPVPVNIMATADKPSPRQLAELGVARISYGPGPYRQMIDALQEAGRLALSWE